MSRVRYLDWLDGQERFLDLQQTLRRIFSWLLIQEDGDVESALEQLEYLGERHGLFRDGYGMDEFRRDLERDRLVSGPRGSQDLTPRGERFIRADSLDQIFGNLQNAPGGDHDIPQAGESGEPLAETRPYAFGDEIHDIDYARSLQNSMRRAGLPGGGDRLSLHEEDLEVRERERFVSAATVLMLDISHSMILYGEDRITPAKRVALALVELIRTRYPKDSLHLVLFGDDAREVPLRELPYAGVGPYHTNTHAGLRLARHILMRKKHSNRQIFMITDGKPTALMERGELYLNPFGLDEKIVRRTLNEAAECRRYKIPITTFMLAREPLLVDFVKTMTETNRGRAYFSSLRDLEQKVFVDFIRNRSRRVR
ncbi:MAG: vWA domain-containing protein [Planctomycetota bacterium]